MTDNNNDGVDNQFLLSVHTQFVSLIIQVDKIIIDFVEIQGKISEILKKSSVTKRFMNLYADMSEYKKKVDKKFSIKFSCYFLLLFLTLFL